MKRILLLVIIIIPFFYCRKQNNSKDQDLIVPESREGAEQFVLVDTRGNRKNWVLKAEHAQNFGDSVILYDLTVAFYDSQGEYNSTLTADSGIVYSPNGNMSALGHVVVVSEDSTILKTNYLDWLNKKKKIVTEDYVEITKKNSVITGKGMVSDPNLEHIEIQSEFNAVSRDLKEE